MSTSKIVSLVSFVAVAVRATNGVRGNNERISCSRENQTLKAARLLLFDFPLENNKLFNMTFELTFGLLGNYQCIIASNMKLGMASYRNNSLYSLEKIV